MVKCVRIPSQKETNLMNKGDKSGSRCTRCGKTRIVIRTYKKKVNDSEVFYTLTGCSDKECQKKVDQQLKKEKEKREHIKKEQLRREEQRKRNSKKRTAANKKSSK